MPLHFRLEDLNENMRKQALDQISPKGNAVRVRADGAKEKSQPPPEKPTVQDVDFVDYTPKTVAKPPVKEYSGTPNKTEAEYNEKVLESKGRYEAVTLRLPGGNYTPDWMTIDDGEVTLHEVKGAYRFGSESRAVLAFRTAASMFPFFRFVWAQKQKGGQWVVKRAVPAVHGC